MNYFLAKEKWINGIERLLKSQWLVIFLVILLLAKIATLTLFTNFFDHFLFADITRRSLIFLLNQERQKQGLMPLKENERLNLAAHLKAQDMIEKNYFSHLSPEGIDPWYWLKKVGYNYQYAGENLAVGFIDSEEVYRAWYNSPTHRANLLNPNYQEVGTAILRGFGPNKTTVIVQFFGSPKPVIPSSLRESVKKSAFSEVVQEGVERKEEQLLPEDKQTNQFNEGRFGLILGEEATKASNAFYLKFLNYVFYSLPDLLQTISWFSFAVFLISFFVLVFINEFSIKRELLIRSFLLLALTILNLLCNNDLLVSLLPHQLQI